MLRHIHKNKQHEPHYAEQCYSGKHIDVVDTHPRVHDEPAEAVFRAERLGKKQHGKRGAKGNQFRGRGAVPGKKTYLSKITRKTGFLFAACCTEGAHLGGLNDDCVKQAARFGGSFSAAFQIKDDLLDILGSKSAMGKPVGNDLKEGVFTLPVLLAAAKNAETKALVEQFINCPEERSDSSIKRIHESVIKSGGAAEAESILKRYISRAENNQAKLPQTQGSEMLSFIMRGTFAEYM